MSGQWSPKVLESELSLRSCYVCSLRQTCGLRLAVDQMITDFPMFIDTGGPSPPPWQWLIVATARACLHFDYREET